MVKSKVRFDGLDVSAMVAHWNRVALGRRVINIYNGPNGDTYIFKLDKRVSGGDAAVEGSESGIGNEKSNLLLLMESGVRFHTSHRPYENPGMPSQFCAKLRKHLRGLRLEQVTQLGKMDRVVHLVFGSGDAQRHSLMLEFYARGNIVLTNSSYRILSLLRSHEYTKSSGKDGNNDDEDNNKETVQVKVGHAYPVTYATTLATKDDEIDEQDVADAKENELLLTAKNPLQWFHNQSFSKQQRNSKEGKKGKKTENNSSQNAWKQLLLTSTSGVSYYGPSLLEHCLRCADLWGVDKIIPIEMTSEDEWKNLQKVLQEEGGRIINDIQTKESKGYILYQRKEQRSSRNNQDDTGKPKDLFSNAPDNSQFDGKILLEFQPHLLRQHESMSRLDYKTFDDAVDTFFSHLEEQKRALRAEQHQAQAEQRLEKIRLDQEQRVASLVDQQELLQEQARLVEMNADMVEKALHVVNSALDSGMDWDQLEDLVDLEKTQNQNPVALLIHKLDLEHDQMVLRLIREDALYEDDVEREDVGSNPRYRDVTVSLNETAHGNATQLFAKYRASKEKSQKTIEASAKALEAAEENAKRQLMEVQKKTSSVTVQAKRKPLWFEKFNWFVTTDNYLVLGGRDAQQNEVLVKRYLRPGDAYLHADVHGAASCILRAKRRRDPKTGKTIPIPLSGQALREAGNFTICRSSAWSSRMVTSAWWVESHQVSKTAPTGEYLTVGSFMVRGKKNFLPPSQLEMGLGVLFRLGDDDSVSRHKNERRDFALMQMEDDEGDVPMENFAATAVDTTKAKRKDTNNINAGNFLSDTVSERKNEGKEIETTDLNTGTAAATIKADPEMGEVQEKEEFRPENEVHSVEKGAASETGLQKKKKGLSVKERKLVKKYGSLEAAKEAEEGRRRQEDTNQTTSETASVISKESSQAASNHGNHKRGKKAKMKRMAKKYADQDEEDRELALLLLKGGEKDKRQNNKKKVPQINEKEREAAADTISLLTKDSTAIAEQLPATVRDALAKCINVADSNNETLVRWDKFDGDVLEQLQSFELTEQMEAAADRLLVLKETSRIDNFSASLSGIIRTIKKYGHQELNTSLDASNGNTGTRKTKVEKEKEEQSWKKTLADEGIVDGGYLEDEDAVDDTIELSKLTGKPQSEDLVLFAVPICAPYQSLSQIAYRVKLTPGNMKRGKASKQCVEMFLRENIKAPGSDRCRDLIRKVADNEWVQAICGDVKISAAGAAKAIQRAKGKGGKNKK
jgi:predicted ribosome quality control (RQC) complex YloA/Tae2 family protein